MANINALLAGSTGLVGSNILTTLLSHPSIAHTSAFTRRALPHDSPKLSTLPASPSPDQDSAALWPTLIPTATPTPTLYLSALGTTLAQSGSASAQRLIDYDLNLALATAAKAAGIKTFVLISTAGASSGSAFAYPKMKGELEEAVRALEFEHTVILRPGLIVGERADARPAEFALRKVAGFAGCLGNGFKDFWAQDAEVIARAAVAAGVKCVEGAGEKGVWEVGQKDIVRLGRTEWAVEEQKK
ncbi:nad dependent epimerase dehydratase family protein [Diplodia corticola]|uniref:Nad dependent epimerase dehydratase family protein n=1 Tax=Diplodia corticola TaxID=236234 RepID=A0A1J9S060_9PEZI|nr:nad dependent epimerase dehydratase family protein [Diplodia corticola]OJD33975.1 nad dependent epimerase dehydratase family protein [Diplodia corticola]